MSGRTFLPMPNGIENIFNRELQAMEGDSEEAIDYEFLNNVEEIIMKWTAQVTEILLEDNTLVFVKEPHPLPFAGTIF